jgi:NAD(P)-dependent dehydrogenase (short-subunit alcohol dehydrogenase family)
MTSLPYWNDKKILITGGSTGLGRALALQLTQAGAQVAVLARTQEKLQRLQQEEPRLQVIVGDVSKKDDIHRIYAEALQKLGGIDLLVNNASSLGPTPLRLLLDTDCEDFQAALDTNLLGPFRLTKLVLPAMILKKKGVIVNISSDAAIQDYPQWGAYSISKSALDHMTRIFQAELVDTGVRFLAVDPGDMNTALHRTALPEADTSQLYAPEDSAKLLLELLETEDFSAQHRGLR